MTSTSTSKNKSTESCKISPSSLSLHLRSTPCKKSEVLQSSVSHSWHLHHTCRHLKGAPPEPSSVPQEERGVPSAARLAPSAAAVRAVLSAMETEGSWEKNNQPTNKYQTQKNPPPTNKTPKKTPTTKTHYRTKIKINKYGGFVELISSKVISPGSKAQLVTPPNHIQTKY